MKKYLLALCLVLLCGKAFAQKSVEFCLPSTSNGVTTCIPAGTVANPLHVTGGGGGSGTVNIGTAGLIGYYATTGTAISPIATGNAITTVNATINTTQPSDRNVTITTDTILSTDANINVVYNSASAVAVTLPIASSAGFTQGFSFNVNNINTGTVTITPTTSTINGAVTLAIPANTGCLIRSNSSNYLVDLSSCSALSSAALAIGGSVTSGTAKSVLFLNSGPVLAQDNSNFSYDSTQHFLGIGTATPTAVLDVWGGNPQISSSASTGTALWLRNHNTSGQDYIFFASGSGGTGGGRNAGAFTFFNLTQNKYNFGITSSGGVTIGNTLTNTQGSSWASLADGTLISGIIGISPSVTPVDALSIGGQSAQAVRVQRELSAATAGQNLTVQAGGAISVGTNLSGGNLVLSSGISTGTGTSAILMKVFPAGSSGTTDNTAATALTISGNKAVSYQGTNPTLTCGTSPSVDSNATSMSGTVTDGSGILTSCVVTFVPAFTSYAHCRVTPETASLTAFGYSVSVTALTVTATSLTNAVFDYSCDGI